MERCRDVGKNQNRKAPVFVYAKAGREGRGNREKGSRGSVGSRHERKSREEGCGGFVFTDHRHTENCGFVRQRL